MDSDTRQSHIGMCYKARLPDRPAGNRGNKVQSPSSITQGIRGMGRVQDNENKCQLHVQIKWSLVKVQLFYRIISR